MLDEAATIESDRVAQGLYRAAAADDRPALVDQLNALTREPAELQRETWALVEWRAGLTLNPAPPPSAGAETEPGRQDSREDEPAADGRPRMTREEANARAMHLVEKGLLNPEWGQRKWAACIGCSVGLVGKLQMWITRMKVDGRGGKDHRRRPRTVRLTTELEGVVGREDQELQRLVGEQNVDDEPSAPDSRTAKVYGRTRL
jgi:hypothetical protein